MYVQADYFEWIFDNGIKRSPGEMVPQPDDGMVLNLGSGNAPMEGAINLDLPHWAAPYLDGIDDESVAAVHMYHFLEHLDPTTAGAMMAEIARVLVPGGVCYIAVPHAMCPLAYQAPDHRTFWTEEGLQDWFYSAGYDAQFGSALPLDIVWMMVAGIKWSNLCVLAQIAKRIDNKPYDTPWRRS